MWYDGDCGDIECKLHEVDHVLLYCQTILLSQPCSTPLIEVNLRVTLQPCSLSLARLIFCSVHQVSGVIGDHDAMAEHQVKQSNSANKTCPVMTYMTGLMLCDNTPQGDQCGPG